MLRRQRNSQRARAGLVGWQEDARHTMEEHVPWWMRESEILALWREDARRMAEAVASLEAFVKGRRP